MLGKEDSQENVLLRNLGRSSVALREFLQKRDSLYAGRETKVVAGAMTIRELFDRCLSVKQEAIKSGDMVTHSFHQYQLKCNDLSTLLDLDRAVVELGPEDFMKASSSMDQPKVRTCDAGQSDTNAESDGGLGR